MDRTTSDRNVTNISSVDRLINAFPTKGGSVVREKSSRRSSTKNSTILNMLITLKPVSNIDALEAISLDDQTEKTGSSTPEQHLAARWGTRESFVPQLPLRDNDSEWRDCHPAPTRRLGDSINFSKAETGSNNGKEFSDPLPGTTCTIGAALVGNEKTQALHRSLFTCTVATDRSWPAFWWYSATFSFPATCVDEESRARSLSDSQLNYHLYFKFFSSPPLAAGQLCSWPLRCSGVPHGIWFTFPYDS